MIKHIWSVLCQRAVVDSQSNNISLIDIFEQVQVNFPVKEGLLLSNNEITIPVQYNLVCFWTKTLDEEEKADIRVLIIGPNGEESKQIDKELIIPKQHKRMRDILKIQGILLKGDGIYNFVISYKQDKGKKYVKVAEIPLEVRINK